MVCIVCRTDNAIKNHWNSTMRRKFETEEETQLIPDNAVMAYPIPVMYPEQLPSPVQSFNKLDQLQAGQSGYWPCISSRDGPPTVATHKSGPDVPLPDFSDWLNVDTYTSSSVAPVVSRSVGYASFDSAMSNDIPFRPSSHATSPLYSVGTSAPASFSSMNSSEAQMTMPYQLSRGLVPPSQASPLLMHHQHQPQLMFSRPSSGGNAALLPTGQSSNDVSLLPHQMMTDYHSHHPATVCSFIGVLAAPS